MLPGVLGLIQEGGDLEATLSNTGPCMNNGTSDLTDSIMSSARMFQTQASGSRLAKAPIAYARSGLTGIRTRNLDIAAQVTAERKAKSEETKHLDMGIRITAGLWESHKNKISQVCDALVVFP
jgi:hypothetical protein